MKLKNRLRLDIFMTILLAFEMFFELTGDVLHEIVGFAFFITIFVHLALSAKWARSVSRSISAGRASKRSIVHAVFGIVLLLAFIPLVVSSIAISHILSGAGLEFTFLFTYMTWSMIHTFAAYAVCTLTVVHLAMHWKSFVNVCHVPYDPSRRAAISTCVGVTAGIATVALSVAGANALRAFALPVSDADDASQNTSSELDGTMVNDKTMKSVPADAGSSSSSTSASSSESASDASNKDQSASSDSSSSDSYEPSEPPSSSSSNTVTGYCNLCKKRCPLSAPQCDKPYQAGLI